MRWRENWKLSACAKQAICFVVENEKKTYQAVSFLVGYIVVVDLEVFE